MQEHNHKPMEAVSFCFLGDVGYNMGDTLMIGAAKMGMDIRFAGPRSSWPTAARKEEVIALANDTGARITITAACDFVRKTHGIAAIGALEDAAALLCREAGTIITMDAAGIEYTPRNQSERS